MNILSRVIAYLACASIMVQPAYASVIPSIPYNLTNGALADATQVMGNFNTIVTDVNANAANSGVNTNITSLTGLTTPLAPSYGGTAIYVGGTTGGSANAQTLAAVTPTNFALVVGNIVTGIAGYTNTGATTLNVNGTGATALRVSGGAGLSALVGGEIFTGNSYTWYYDGTYLILLNPSEIANAALAPMAANTVKVNATGSAAAPTDLAMGASTILARLAAGNVVAATPAQVYTLLAPAVMTKQYLTSGTSATYTTPAGCREIVVKEVGGGGGGGAVTTNNGGTGGTTTFNSVTAIGGGGGGYATTAQGGVGGTGGTGTANRRVQGQGGGATQSAGGNSMLGMGARGSYAATGDAAAANSGGGGAGGDNSSTEGGGSGGGGEYAEIIIPSPSATYTYTVGAGGTGGSAGTTAGGNGGSGVIIVEEYY